MSNISKEYNEILNRIKEFRDKEITIKSIDGFIKVLVFSFISIFLFVSLEAIFHFSSFYRSAIIIFFFTLLVSLFTIFVFVPFSKYFQNFKNVDLYKYASIIGSMLLEKKDELLNHIQLISNKGTNYSNQLIVASFSRFYLEIKNISFKDLLNYSKIKKVIPAYSAIILFCCLILGFVPNLNAALIRLYYFENEFIKPQRLSISIKPGNISITKYSDINVKVSITGDKPGKVTLLSKDETMANFEMVELVPDSNGIYNHHFGNIRSSIDYYVIADEINSESYSIKVVDRPIIHSLSLKIASPLYSAIPEKEQIDNGNVECLTGSTITFEILTNKELSNAYILINDSTKKECSINSNFAFLDIVVKNSFNYKIILKDKEGNFNISPVEYSVSVSEDLFPTIKLISPSEDTNLNTEMREKLLLNLSDDYGVSKLLLFYKLSASVYESPMDSFRSIPIPITPFSKEQTIEYIWNLSSLNLATEDVVSFYLTVYDNDNINGPKSSSTQILSLRMPSLSELFKESEEDAQNIEAELKDAMQKAADLKKELEKLDKDLKQDKRELNWEEKERIQDAAKNFDELSEKIEDISKKVEESRKELQENKLLSNETLEKYLELQKLLDELSSDELKEAMKKMSDQIQNMMRNQAQDQLKDMQFDEEMFNKSLERTLNLFKRLQVEKKIDELIKRTEDAINKQDDIKDELAKQDISNKDNREQLTKQQDKISKEMKELSKELQKLQDKMSEMKDMPSSDMEKLQEEFEDQKNDELSENAENSLEKMQKQEAMQNQSKISKNLNKTKSSLSNLQSQMQQDNQMKSFSDMVKLLNDLISLSKEQEKIMESSRNNWRNSSGNENAKSQNELKSNLERVITKMNNLAQKSFAITPEMGKELGDAKKEMTNALESIQNKNSSLAANSQSGAMKSINNAASLIKGMMDMMMQGGQGGQGGMMSMMQKMQQMSQQQMGLNQMTQMLQKGMQGQMTPEQQGQMQRLAKQQEVIQKSLEQLNKEARESGKSKSIPSNIEETLKQMKEVVSDMQTEKLNDELIQKQEKILSKLLDAQKSINERDYEKERESKTADYKNTLSPGKLSFDKPNSEKDIKQLINNAVREGYVKDFEDMIKKYYEGIKTRNN